MATTSDVSALPPWARGELTPETKCAHSGHSRAHPINAVALVTEWFGQTEGQVRIGWRNYALPLPVCRRHLTTVQEWWERTAAQKEKVARTAARATELKEALAYFRETTGVALDAGLGNIGRPDMVFTLDATQLRHLAHAMDDTLAPGGPNMDEEGAWRDVPLEAPPGPAEKALAEVIQFPGGRY